MHVCIHVDIYAYVFTYVCVNGYILYVCIFVCLSCTSLYDFPGGSTGKESACNARAAGDMGSIPGLGRSTGRGNCNPLHYSCLENPVDRGAWQATVHRVAKSQILTEQLSTAQHVALET